MSFSYLYKLKTSTKVSIKNACQGVFEASHGFVPIIFILSFVISLIISIMKKCVESFCPYDFSKVVMISAHGLPRFWPFLRPQAIKKGACQSFVAYSNWRLGKARYKNKHDVVHA